MGRARWRASGARLAPLSGGRRSICVSEGGGWLACWEGKGFAGRDEIGEARLLDGMVRPERHGT